MHTHARTSSNHRLKYTYLIAIIVTVFVFILENTANGKSLKQWLTFWEHVSIVLVLYIFASKVSNHLVQKRKRQTFILLHALGILRSSDTIVTRLICIGFKKKTVNHFSDKTIVGTASDKNLPVFLPKMAVRRNRGFTTKRVYLINLLVKWVAYVKRRACRHRSTKQRRRRLYTRAEEDVRTNNQ